MSSIHTLEYTGRKFGRPDDPPIASSVVHGHLSAYAAGQLLMGQDSTDATGMTPGLSVYCGYEYGNFANLGSVMANYRGAKYLGITPYVAKADVLDVEPGDATAADCPSFVALGKGTDAALPVIYCSAGDTAAVIAALGDRSTYLIWSAHWIGLHICGPSTCGYPQADGTQYANTSTYDSDVFQSYIFPQAPAPVVVPPTSPWPLLQGSVGSLVLTLQQNLNRWSPFIRLSPELAEDSDYGALTAAAVTLAQSYFGQKGVPVGECNQALFNALAAPVPSVLPGIPVQVGQAVLSTGSQVTMTWTSVLASGVTQFTWQVERQEESGWAVVLDGTTQQTSAVVTGLVPRTPHRWRVSGGNWSAWSSFTTQ